MTMAIALRNINLTKALANKNCLILAAAARIDLTARVTFVEKMPTMPEYSTEKPSGKVGNERHAKWALIGVGWHLQGMSNIEANHDFLLLNQQVISRISVHLDGFSLGT